MRALAGGTLAAVLAVSACGAVPGTTADHAGRDDGLVARLEAMPGVASADVAVPDTSVDDDGVPWSAATDMTKDATADQVAAVLDVLAEWEHGLVARREPFADEVEVAVTLAAGRALPLDSGHPDGRDGITVAGKHARNLVRARFLLAAAPVLDSPVVVDRYGWHAWGDDPGAVLDEVAAHGEFAAFPGLVIDRAAEGESVRIGSAGPVTPAFVAAYHRAERALGAAREATAMLAYFGSPQDAEEFAHPRRHDEWQVRLQLKLPGHAGPAALSSPPTADPRWAVVRAEADAVAAMPRGAGLLVWLMHDGGHADRCCYDQIHPLVDYVTGERPREEKAPAWDDAVAAYVDSLTA